MEIIREEYKYLSATGVGDVFARSWSPADESQVKGIIQVAHGMAEHGERYQAFAYYMAYHGYAVFINDHIGHGRSVASEEELGYFGEKDGWKGFISDARVITLKAAEKYPGCPIIFFGHSMGSFVARSYVEKYGKDLAGAVFCGTSGTNPAASAGIALTNVISKFKGSHHRSEFIDHIAFGAYNNKIESPETKFDWLTRDKEEVKAYIEDPLCGFLFTAAGYRDMFTLLKSVSDARWYKAVPKNLPMYIIAGEADPVGAYGKGVKQVYNDLKSTGHKNVTMKLYEGARHEILNEINGKDVMKDLLEWADGLINK
ncbi:MAG: lysophospholipase [Clostridia bacterium]|nr:lysophospholipase [Clostridia bacterium]